MRTLDSHLKSKSMTKFSVSYLYSPGGENEDYITLISTQLFNYTLFSPGYNHIHCSPFWLNTLVIYEARLDPNNLGAE